MLPSALPFFLKAHPGERFCLYHEPDPQQPACGAILYVHPFAEELNRTRRMAALQSRALAAAGYGVLQIDLYGCGDSSGDFGDARLQIWRADLAMAQQWLLARITGPLFLWGVRFGALLALDYAAAAQQAPHALLLWQAVTNGAGHLKQFLRVHSAARIFGGDGAAVPADIDAAEQGIEVAGYQIAPELSCAIAGLDARDWPPRCPVHWFELGLSGADDQAALALPAASASLVAHWRNGGASIRVYPYAGHPFWSSAETNVCPALLTATAALIASPPPQP